MVQATAKTPSIDIERVQSCIYKWWVVLLVLMILDVIISASAINGTAGGGIQEGNTFAVSLGVLPLAVLKIIFTLLLGLWSLYRRSSLLLKVSSGIMGLVMMWNVIMVLIYGR
jgi:hypothetical protein